MFNFRQELLDFDPNKTNSLPFATFSPYRTPGFKAHTTRATALSALMMQNDLVSLYAWSESASQWVFVACKDKEGTNGQCALCGSTTLEPAARGNSTVNTGEYDWLRTGGGKIQDPLTLVFMCKDCKRHRIHHGYR